MIKNREELKEKIKKSLEEKAEKFIEELNMSDEEFTIDAIEDIMTRFTEDTNQIMLESVNEAIASFDESQIISKKKTR